MTEKEIEKQKLKIKSVALSIILINVLEELEEHDLLRHKLKLNGKRFLKELDSYIDEVYNKKHFKTKEDKDSAAEFILHTASGVNINVDKFINQLYGDEQE